MSRKVICYLVFSCLVFFAFVTSAQNNNNKAQHHRAVVSHQERWTSGAIDDTRHVVDSFFYQNGVLKEVSQSIITRKRFRVVDSIPVNGRMVWDQDGRLELEEFFKDGKIIELKSFYKPYMNLIPNGSFEQHSEVPKHIIEKELVHFIRCLPVDSILKREVLYCDISNNDTIEHVLVTHQTRSLCESDPSSMVQQYVLVQRNGCRIDSIFVDMPFYLHKGIYHLPKLHSCNYEKVDVDVWGWESIGQQFPDIYDLANKAPHSPLRGFANRVFSFNSIEGSSFVKLSWKETNAIALSNCNPYYLHPLLQTKLNSSLKKNSRYYLEFWLWKPEVYPDDYMLKICFSQEPVGLQNYTNCGDRLLDVQVLHDDVWGQWQKVALSFDAPDFARYMTIGFFDAPKDVTTETKSIVRRWCYVDGFVLVADSHKDKVILNFYPDSPDFTATTIEEPAMVFNHQKVEKETPVLLENILFEHDSYILLPSSIPALKELAMFMDNNSDTRIKVCGHTDDTGSEEYNKHLSAKRAEAVVIKLVELGIEVNRLAWVGYGSSVPLTDNDSDIGKAKNRRVEFVVLEDRVLKN